MKHILVTLFAAALSMSAAGAVDLDTYYKDLPFPVQAPAQVQIPASSVSILDFGGNGDGIADNTEAFANALAALEKMGGGRLNVPRGIFLTGPIVLKDRMELHLERGAMILFTPDRAVYINKGRAVPCISASKRCDIAITGEGVIDGNGAFWRPVKRSKVSDVEWKDYQRMGGTVIDNKLWYPFELKHIPDIAGNPKDQEKMRNHLIRFTDCERILVEGVTLQNSPKFHLVPQRCKDVTLTGITVRCPWNAQNGDGIDLMNTSRVLIARCMVDVGDDGICLKAGAGQDGFDRGPCEDILIVENTVFHAHGGFVIGSEFSGGVKNTVVRGNTFSGTDTGLRFKSAPERGGKTENLSISDITMNGIRDEAIVFETSYADRPAGNENAQAAKTKNWLPEFAGIDIRNVVCRDCRIAVRASGSASEIHDNTISDSVFFFSEKGLDSAPGMLRLKGVRMVTYPAL